MGSEIGSMNFHPNYTASKFMLYFVCHCVKVIAIKKEKQQNHQFFFEIKI